MGHRSIETTMDIYAKVTDKKKQESMEHLSHKLDVFQERVLNQDYEEVQQKVWCTTKLQQFQFES